MRAPSHKGQAGFGLVEIMVGLVIGLIATLVIMQVYATFESQKRTTSGGADAQTNGLLALYALQRDAGSAGFGLPVADPANNAFNCPIATTIDPDGAGPIPGLPLTPVSVTDGGAGAGNSDSLALRFGAGTFNMGAGATKMAIVAGNTLNVSNSLACQPGDIALVINGTTACDAAIVSTVTPPTLTQITLLAAPASAVTNARIACLGQPTTAATPGAWNQDTYSITNGQLVLAQNGSAATTPIASNIVNMQIQYGVSAAGANDTITQWVDPSGGTWAVPTLANRNRIKAIRVAVVARNGQLEKANVTNACSSTITPAPTGLCAWAGTVASPAPTINVSDDANWQRYRYRVFSAIIPLRSMIWSGGN